MEEPIFKFKKQKVTVGDIDVNGPSEWELLIRTDTNDLPQFLHYHKLWNIVETEDQLDPEGEVVSHGTKKQPIATITAGFIKEDKFIVTNQQTISALNYHDTYKKFKKHLELRIAEGWRKDTDRYVGEFAAAPQYYANERTPLTSALSPQISQSISQSVAVASQPSAKKGLTNMLRTLGNLQQSKQQNP